MHLIQHMLHQLRKQKPTKGSNPFVTGNGVLDISLNRLHYFNVKFGMEDIGI